MDDLYTETILDHYKYPRNAQALSDATVRVTEHNPLCGDTIQLDLIGSPKKITNIGFTGQGCAISQAGTSLLTETIKGMAPHAIVALSSTDMLALLGVPISPGRMKCALLGLGAAKKAAFLIQTVSVPTKKKL